MKVFTIFLYIDNIHCLYTIKDVFLFCDFVPWFFFYIIKYFIRK